jgi:asparagine synthetase B (glutamine-hydrolysing)
MTALKIPHLLPHVQSWSVSNPTEFHIEQWNTVIRDHHNFGGGMVLPIGGAAQKIMGGTRSCYAYQSAPGTIPLYLIVAKDEMHISNSYLEMRRFVNGHPTFKIKDIQTAKEGIAYHLSAKGLRRYVVDELRYEYTPKFNLKGAGDALLEALKAAAEPLRGRKVLTPISGGTDGLITALAIKEAGIDQICVCVGRTEEDFDPKYARKYAEQLGLDYRFLPLDLSTDEAITDLLYRTLTHIEMTDFSNVLMGMCNTLIAEYALAQGCDIVLTADLADVILGNDIMSVGKFRQDTPHATAPKWAEYRIKSGLRNLPNNFEIWKAFNFAGIETTQLFNDRNVIELILGMPLEVTPVETKKPLYYEVLDRYVSGGSWHESKKKVGFYTGSGIGKIRLENPLLSDENIRKVFASL